MTVAVLDTGFWWSYRLQQDPQGRNRLLRLYDAILNQEYMAQDENGHGTHVTSVLLSSEQSAGGYHSLAPFADLVSVKAFDRDGKSTYADVIRGLDWILDRQNDYGIRVLNLSFSAEAQSYYWDDPLNQAVMALWQAGVVVVHLGRQRRSRSDDRRRAGQLTLCDHRRCRLRQLHSRRR